MEAGTAQRRHRKPFFNIFQRPITNKHKKTMIPPQLTSNKMLPTAAVIASFLTKPIYI